VARNDILTLWRAFRHVVSSNLHNILGHTELLTAAVSWFAQVCSFLFVQEMHTHMQCKRHLDFPESAAKLGEVLWA
jgi:hypothetical protein